jgi:hypothetical protein
LIYSAFVQRRFDFNGRYYGFVQKRGDATSEIYTRKITAIQYNVVLVTRSSRSRVAVNDFARPYSQVGREVTFEEFPDKNFAGSA